MSFYNKKKGNVAHTQYDDRYTRANQVSNGNLTCSSGKRVTATQQGKNITLSCECGHENTTVRGSTGDGTGFARFNDTHP